MRIRDPEPTPSLYASSPATSSSPAADARAFPEVLQQLQQLTQQASSSPQLMTTHMQLHMEMNLRASANDLKDQELDDVSLAETHRTETVQEEQSEVHTELLEQREDADIEDMIENQEAMEDLIDAWEEQGEEDPSIETETVDEEIFKEDIEESGDENPELFHQHDDPEEKSREEQKKIEAIVAAGATSTEIREAATERDLTYQDIQKLTESALSKGKLAPRVKNLLRTLLESLAQGQRFLLDQHRLAGLDFQEWQEITALFPLRFYGGLVRQSLQKSHKHVVQLHGELQHLQHQRPLTQNNRDFWKTLWEPLLEEWPLLLNNWLHQHPIPEDIEGISHILEILHKRNALPTGAVGQVLQLALNYQHHPATFYGLFGLTQHWLQAAPMKPEDITLLSEKVYERCFAGQLSDKAQVTEALNQVLAGQSVEEDKLMQILQGCRQGVLSYLPYRYLPPEIQELQDYVQQDLLGKEEAILQLLLESESPQTL